MNKPATILVIEDDENMRHGLRDNLEMEGYHVVAAGSAREARDAVAAHKPDLIIMDVMLPDGDGISLCRQLRARGLNQPVIMLTAKSEEIDKLLGFEVGADDYVVKPFSLRELLARIHARLKRPGSSDATDDGVAVGIAVVDFRRHLLFRNGQTIDTSAREMELLNFFVNHRGEVISRDGLMEDLWGYQTEITTRTVDNFIVRLRKKIEPEPADPRYLVTVHGRGYKLVEQ